MKTFNKIILISLSCCLSFIAEANVTNTALEPIHFDGNKPVYKTGTLIKNGKIVEYKKCQYKNPKVKNQQQADPKIDFCS